MRSTESPPDIAGTVAISGPQSPSESVVPLPRDIAWLPEEPEDDKQPHSWHSLRKSIRLTLAAIAAGGLLMFGSIVSMALTQRGDRTVPGPLIADHNRHHIESIRAGMSAPSARFLLRAYGAPLVTEVSTDLQCASARLIQGGQNSRWFGFSHPGEQVAGVQMLPFQPAYLEVRINPAIHELDAPNVDKLTSHNVLLKTEDGQTLSFEVATGAK